MNEYIVDIDEYRVIKTLGRGASGEVFLVEEINTKKQYAAKVSLNQCIQKQDHIIFFTEVDTLINAKSPAILKMIGFSLCDFSHQPFPTIILEYMPNGSLSQVIEKSGRGIAPHEWTSTKMYINLLGIAIGLKYLHSQNTVQRDIKPANVLLDENYYPHVSDFGYSKKLIDLNSINLMNSGVGTLVYMAPEILEGLPYNYKIDVYSYSILAYEIITSRSPLPKGEPPMRFISRVPDGKRPDISFIKDQVQIDFLQKCWSNDPSERPSFPEIVDILKDKKFYSTFNVDEDEVNEYLELFPGEHLTDNSPSKGEIEKVPEIENGDSIYKVVLFGDPCSEKTKLISQFHLSYKKNKNKKDSEMNDLSPINEKIYLDSGVCNLQIWDPNKQDECIQSLHGAHAIVLVCNANVKDQLESLQHWKNFVKKNMKAGSDPFVYIAATNCFDGCLINPEEIHEFASSHDYRFFPIRLNRIYSIVSMFEKISVDLLGKHDEDKQDCQGIQVGEDNQDCQDCNDDQDDKDDNDNMRINDYENPNKTCLIY